MEPRFSVRATARQGSPATAYVRARSFEVGLPLTFDPEYGHVTALELVLGAVAGELVTGLLRLARERRLAVHHVEAVCDGELDNPLTHLGVVGEEGHPGLVGLSVKVFVDSDEDEAGLRRAWDETLARSPLVHTFRSVARLDLTLSLG